MWWARWDLQSSGALVKTKTAPNSHKRLSKTDVFIAFLLRSAARKYMCTLGLIFDTVGDCSSTGCGLETDGV